MTPVKHFSRTETKIRTQNEAHSMLQHLLDHLQGSQRISDLQQQPVHHQWVPITVTPSLWSYTHSVLKNCLDFVMSITKCLLFRGLLETPVSSEKQHPEQEIPHPMLLLLLCFIRGQHTFKLWSAYETMDNRPLANTFFRGTCSFRHNWECIKFFLSLPWVCFHLLQALCLGIHPE